MCRLPGYRYFRAAVLFWVEEVYGLHRVSSALNGTVNAGSFYINMEHTAVSLLEDRALFWENVPTTQPVNISGHMTDLHKSTSAMMSPRKMPLASAMTGCEEASWMEPSGSGNGLAGLHRDGNPINRISLLILHYYSQSSSAL